MKARIIAIVCFLVGFVAYWMISQNMNDLSGKVPSVPTISWNASKLLRQACHGSCDCALSRKLDSKLKDLKTSLVVYIYDFPNKFHKMLEDTYRNKSRYDLSYESFGNIVRAEDGMVFRNTYQGAFDIIFHKRLRDTWNLTQDPEKADVFFVPYYHDMTMKENLNTRVIKNGDLKKELSKLPYYEAKRPHFLAIGWPLVLQGYSFLEMTVERWGSVGKLEMLVVPYPSYGHVTRPVGHKYAQNLFVNDRKVFLFMAARDRTFNLHRERAIRHKIYTSVTRRTMLPMDKEYKFSNMSQKDKIEAINFIPDKYTPDIATAIVEWMHNAIFCLQPPGDSATRKSFYDAIMCGCIPVIFALGHKVEYPFESVLDYSTFSVTIPLNKHLQFLDVLHAYNQSDIVNMQQSLRCVMQYLQYNDVTAYDAGPDAFTMIMMEVKSRFNVTSNNTLH